MPQRPLLTAEWRNFVLLNFPVPTDIIANLAPPSTEPDLHNGQSYISIVGFSFQNVRLFGVPVPGHTNFPEINLRYYVRRTVDKEVRRGVVFAREIVPRRAVAILANHLYNESYITRPMRSDIRIVGAELSPDDTIEYSWKSRSRQRIPLPFREGLGEGSAARSSSHPWNHLAAQVTAHLAFPTPDSLEEFLVEHYWGYVRGRDGQTREYRVVHNPWRVAPAESVIWDCDIATTYDSPLAEFLAAPPTSAIIAEGSPIQLFRGHRLVVERAE